MTVATITKDKDVPQRQVPVVTSGVTALFRIYKASDRAHQDTVVHPEVYFATVKKEVLKQEIKLADVELFVKMAPFELGKDYDPAAVAILIDAAMSVSKEGRAITLDLSNGRSLEKLGQGVVNDIDIHGMLGENEKSENLCDMVKIYKTITVTVEGEVNGTIGRNTSSNVTIIVKGSIRPEQLSMSHRGAMVIINEKEYPGDYF